MDAPLVLCCLIRYYKNFTEAPYSAPNSFLSRTHLGCSTFFAPDFVAMVDPLLLTSYYFCALSSFILNATKLPPYGCFPWLPQEVHILFNHPILTFFVKPGFLLLVSIFILTLYPHPLLLIKFHEEGDFV